jgi:hypothetical protein
MPIGQEVRQLGKLMVVLILSQDMDMLIQMLLQQVQLLQRPLLQHFTKVITTTIAEIMTSARSK